MQVAEALLKYGREMGARVLPIYGGQPIGQQLRGLRRGVDVVVATPGRAVDHLKRGSLRLDGVRVVILDEADEMLDMGFAEDLEAILSATPEERQTALFSATISPTITRIAKRHLRDPARITVHAERATADGVALVRQVAYVVRRTDKLAALCRILDVEDPGSTLVFARTRGEVDDLAEALSARGHDAGALHGGLTQEARDRIMGRFRDGTARRPRRDGRRRARARHRARLARRQLRRARPTPTRTSIGSGGPDGPVARASRSRSSSRASTGCSGTSRPRRTRSSRSPTCRRSPTCGSAGPRSSAPTCARRSSATATTGSGASSSRCPTSSTWSTSPWPRSA